MDEVPDHVAEAMFVLFVGVGRHRRRRRQVRRLGRRACGVGRHVRLHLRGRARKEEAVPEGGVEKIALIVVRPALPVVLEGLLRVDQWRSETVPYAEQGLLVADAEVGVRILSQRDRLEERDFSEDGFLRARGAGRVASVGDPSAVGRRDHRACEGSVREAGSVPGSVANRELVARGGAGRARVGVAARVVAGTSG